MTNKLVAYFSASGVTRRLSQNVAKAANADIYEIKPAKMYSTDDLNWLDSSSRSSIEMKDPNSRPEIIDDGFSIKKYDIIFLGFPIWWYIAPTIINTFLEKHDFSNKKIVLYATSGGSSLGRTIDNIKKSVPSSCQVISGMVLNPKYTADELSKWVESLKL